MRVVQIFACLCGLRSVAAFSRALAPRASVTVASSPAAEEVVACRGSVP